MTDRRTKGPRRPASQTPPRIASFETKPAKGGTPASASVPTTNTIAVFGMARPSRPIGAHVVRVDGVDHRPRGEEQERLEEAVEQEVEHARREGAGAERGHHVAELGHGRVREDALEVGLAERERRRQEGGERADVGDQEEHPRHRLEERVGPRHQEHARRHHRGGVDQRRHRGRALHRVGQPDVERELGALADGAEVDQRHAEREARGEGAARDRPEERVELEGPRRAPEQHDAEEEAHVAELRHPEGLDRGARRPPGAGSRSRSGGTSRGPPAPRR